MILYLFLIALFICIIFRMVAKTKRINVETDYIKKKAYLEHKDKIDIDKVINDLNSQFDK